MQLDIVPRFTLVMIAIFLAMIAFRPVVTPPPVQAQSANAHPFYIEPGYQMLRAPDGSRQVYGKVVIDLRNGKIWGFPTLADQPYPVDNLNKTPPTSHPFVLGNFAFADTEK
ncbi:MAG TPA: hypothetical protein VIX14_02710 [Terriglobales bacterium]